MHASTTSCSTSSAAATCSVTRSRGRSPSLQRSTASSSSDSGLGATRGRYNAPSRTAWWLRRRTGNHRAISGSAASLAANLRTAQASATVWRRLINARPGRW